MVSCQGRVLQMHYVLWGCCVDREGERKLHCAFVDPEKSIKKALDRGDTSHALWH